MRWLGYRSVGSGRCSPVLHLSLLVCFSVPPFALLFSPSRSIPLPRPFHLPPPLSSSRGATHFRRVVVRLFYYFYKCRRRCYHHRHQPPPWRAFPLLGHHGPLLRRRKMRILIRYCLILFMYAHAREPAPFQKRSLATLAALPLPSFPRESRRPRCTMNRLLRGQLLQASIHADTSFTLFTNFFFLDSNVRSISTHVGFSLPNTASPRGHLIE